MGEWITEALDAAEAYVDGMRWHDDDDDDND